jgi:hypothetical protein
MSCRATSRVMLPQDYISADPINQHFAIVMRG